MPGQNDVATKAGRACRHRGSLAEVRRRNPTDHERIVTVGNRRAQQVFERSGLAARDLAVEKVTHELHAVADAEHRHAEREDRGIGMRRWPVDASGSEA